jgi:hypothetical protein
MDLKVPYAEEDQAEALGARWEPSRRCWSVPDGLDLQLFRRWIPEGNSGVPGLNLRSLETYVVTASRRCWHCDQVTIVAGFLMAPGFEDFSVWEDELDGQGRWGGGEGWCFAFHIDALPSPIAAQAIMRAPRYRRAFSQATRNSYWANHCSECGSLQGDGHLFEDLGGPFVPRDADDLASLKAFRVKGVFEAAGSFGHVVEAALTLPGVRAGSTIRPPTAPDRQPATSKTMGAAILRTVRRWLGRRSSD